MQVTKYKKLNQDGRPCNPTPEYNFGKCLHKSISMNAGCQPHWRLFSVDGMPTCDNATMLRDLSLIWANMSLNMDRDDIHQATKCLVPCTFLDYKVCFKVLRQWSQLIRYDTTEAEDPQQII